LEQTPYALTLLPTRREFENITRQWIGTFEIQGPKWNVGPNVMTLRIAHSLPQISVRYGQDFYCSCKIENNSFGFIRIWGSGITVIEKGEKYVLDPKSIFLFSPSFSGEIYYPENSGVCLIPFSKDVIYNHRELNNFELLDFNETQEIPHTDPRYQNLMEVFDSLTLHATELDDYDAFDSYEQSKDALIWEQLFIDQVISTFFLPYYKQSKKLDRKVVVRKAQDIMTAKFPAVMTIADVADNCGVNIRSLQRAFISEIGMSPKAWQRQERLRNAHDELCQLRGDTVSVTDIAAKWGFNDLGRFAKLHREKYSISPKKLLKS